MNTFIKIYEHQKYQLLMLLSIFGYALFSIPFESLGSIFRAIFLIGTLGIFFVHKDKIYKDPMIILLALAILSSIASWINGLLVVQQYTKPFPEIDKLARLFIFIPMAYWLKGKPKLIITLFIMFMTGFILGAIIKSPFINEFMTGINGSRVDFNIKNAQYTSMFSGICFLFSLFMTSLTIKIRNKKNRYLSCLFLVFFLVSSLFFFTMTMISQSRMVFLGVLVVIALFPIIFKISFSDSGYKKLIYLYFATFIVIIILGFFTLPLLEKRIDSGEITAVVSALKLDFNNIPMSSAGIRINSWIEAFHWISQYPLFGIGDRGSAIVIITSKMFADRIDEAYTTIVGLRHLHSFHMDTLVCYGIFGFLVLNGTYFVMLRSLIRIRSVVLNANYWIMLAICVVVYWLTINAFESFNFRTYGVLTHNVFMAGLYSFALTHRLFPTLSDETNNENSGSCQ